MGYYRHGRAEVDSTNPSAFGICDRCGALENLRKLRWQYQYAGTQLINLRLLVCSICLDVPQPQLRTIILPPDPVSVMNARVEYYDQDFNNVLTTQDSDPLLTEDEESYLIPDNSVNDAEED